MPRVKKLWADPNREGQSQERHGKRYCARCGNTVQQARILKSLNLCDFCVKEFEAKRDGIHSCRGCGQVVNPEELRANKGYCKLCVCPACGRPDPQQVRKTGLCFQCSQTIGDFCRICGKEAAAQVRKNRGLCDSCAGQRTAAGKPKRQSVGKFGGSKVFTASAKGNPRRQPVRKSGSLQREK
jgi:hypothetical protein